MAIAGKQICVADAAGRRLGLLAAQIREVAWLLGDAGIDYAAVEAAAASVATAGSELDTAAREAFCAARRGEL